MKHTCPVCGWPELHDAPRDPDGGASFEICPSCGFEFGFDDDDQGRTYETARASWIKGGMQWWSTSRRRPRHWDPAVQLHRAGLK